MGYEYGIDAAMRIARTITRESEMAADEVFTQAQKLGPLPTRYVVKADIRCNQLDTFREIACDWQVIIETFANAVQAVARRKLYEHLIRVHPYLDDVQQRMILNVISFNFRDIGR